MGWNLLRERLKRLEIVMMWPVGREGKKVKANKGDIFATVKEKL